MRTWELDAMADEHYDAIVIGTSQGGRFLNYIPPDEYEAAYYAQTQASQPAARQP
jgi:hypothetical protein